MPKQPIVINFSQGMNTKTDPWQLPIGQFQLLLNTVFTKQGLLQKRNGYSQLTSLPNTTYQYLTTLNDNLTAIGPNVSAYDSDSQAWITKGSITPASVSVLPLIRNSLNQSQCDIGIAPNGLACVAYTESTGPTTSYKYAILNSITGQNVVSPTLLAGSSGAVAGAPRVFVVESYFVIVYTVLISSTYHLQYIAISSANPAIVTAPQDIAAAYVPATTLAWDGIAINDNLYIGYNTTSGGQSVVVIFINISDIILGNAPNSSNKITYSSKTATCMSLCADLSQGLQAIYISFYDSGGSTGYTAIASLALASIHAPVQIISTGTINNLASVAKSGVCSVFIEVSANSISQVNLVTVTYAGSAAAAVIVIRSLGLASKAFYISGKAYFLGAFQSTLQSTYFLVSGASVQATPIVVAKLAYENGGGYLGTGIPNAIVNGTTVHIPYLFKDLILPVSRTNNTQMTTSGGVYAQTGINLASIDLALDSVASVEIANGLQIGGGFGWLYDGYLPVEQGFFLFPEIVSVSTNASAVTPTGTTTSGSNVITAVSSMVGVGLGASVTGTGIPANQLVTGLTSNTITFGPLTATGTHSTETITVTGNISAAQAYYYQAIYQWTDAKGNTQMSAPSIPVTVTTTGSTSTNAITVPTLRITYKTNVKIVLYRWSTAQQIYYQVTSITQPTLNSTTTDSIIIYDCLADASISGNSIIYTTGGVVEDVNPPASNVLTLFDTRAWLVNSEDPNQEWFSKQVIEATPVEWSDLFTEYISPNAGTVSTTGPITAHAPMDDKIIMFKEHSMYYINGQGPDNTGASNGYNGPIFITSTVGCTNPNSIVLIDQGLMFQSNKGIWLLPRGISPPVYIGAAVEAYNSSAVLSAVNIPLENQVRFTLNTGETLMYDYFYNQWGIFEGAPAVSSCIYQSLHSFINSGGNVYQESLGKYLDGASPVLMSFKTGWINLASIQGFERFYYMYLLGRFLSPCKIQVEIAYDYNDSPLQSSIITPDNFSSSSASPFGDQPSPFGASGSVMQWEVHARKQKCSSFQITLTEIFDPSYGVVAGAGFTLSGITLYTLVKSAKRPVKAAHTVG